jgi:hypothetical protein|tara:strand:+ start:1218 stop:1649 length:432 start_codon:yes stop_codon:yes gene_type:complete
MLHDHDFYTKQIIHWVRNIHDSPGLDIQDDTQGSCRPNMTYAWIDGECRKCLPDFVARNISVEPNLYILGEAKTYNDYLHRSDERNNQIDVMLNFLKKQKNPILVYSLPRELAVIAKNKIQEKMKLYGAENICLEILDEYSEI